MADITLTEWGKKLDGISEDILKRWPFLTVERGLNVDTDLSVGVDWCSGRMTLAIEHHGESFVTDIRVSGSRAMNGSLSEVEVGLFECRAVVDALHYLKSITQRFSIWPDGKCPCNWCSSTGRKHGGGKCERCEDGFR